MKGQENMYRMIPKVDELLKSDPLIPLKKEYPADLLHKEVCFVLEKIREKIQSGESAENISMAISNISSDLETRLKNKFRNRLKRVINGTGTVIHTNLGRSLVPQELSEKVSDILGTYSNLEYDLENGKRGSRYSHLEEILCDITGAEDAIVVNNNAAAVLLVLSTFAKGKEVIISRGELIEIGGSFRIPDVMEYGGCTLKEVGTTNKTHLKDYANAITEDTGAIMKVHTSNYRIFGFTEEVLASELRALATEHGIPLIEDLGSGILINLEEYGLTHEPTVQESIQNGIDVVTFSGDKLLGGPQAGIIVGKKDYIQKLKQNQLTRALRVDKITIKLLEEILKLYYHRDKVVKDVPTLHMLTLEKCEVRERAEKLKHRLESLGSLEITIEESYSEVGGGSLPTEKLPTYVLLIRHKDISEQALDRKMRSYIIPIVGRIHNGQYIIDPRTLLAGDDEVIYEAFSSLEEVK
ncbi:MAG: L-seryl-tRNA(Sec) selenium transferase [Tissierellia bacterium]|nr:L-seryl-tRNA(Sec) selenium transferase [Tissierellia bacterium]